MVDGGRIVAWPKRQHYRPTPQQQAADGLQPVQVLLCGISSVNLLLTKVVLCESQGLAVEYHLAHVCESKGRCRVRAGVDEHPHKPEMC